MKAIILAAGRGSRLQGFTEDKPKCLNHLGDKTILERQVAVLRSAGIDDIIIVTGYKAEMLKKFGFKTYTNPRWAETNVLRSLLAAAEEFTEPAIVTYSDIFYGRDTVNRLVKENKDAVVVYDLDWRKLWSERFDNPLDDAESFKIGPDNRITEIGKRVKSLDEIEGQYTGLMRFTPTAFGWIKDFAVKQKDDALDRTDMTSLLGSLITSGHPIYGMAIKGGWCEIDTERDLKLANSLYNER
ncbi:MAG: phosphocholine cytidylyltransferase family protein [Candidatus Omnitrophica bacterium]|nr:phosphocholine cytidylyltransferase family protein [Candidatus Omnitrophota bacterium]